MKAPALASGTSVGGRWKIAAFIGRGELGEVYAARDPLSGQAGALKRFAPELAGKSEAWAAFEETAKQVAALPFDAFAKRIDSGSDAAPWVVTDRIVWPSLAEQVRAGGTLPVERMAAMLDALAPALDAAHKAGLVHRGLKPANVFVEPADKPAVYITDFGAWRLRAALALPPGWTATPGWLGPDAADPAEASTPKMDVFALGLVVFHALTAHCRFPAAEQQPIYTDALWKQMCEPIGSASALAQEFGVTLDAALDGWFSRALSPRPAERFESVGAMAADFRKAIQAAGKDAPQAPPRPGPALQQKLGPAKPPRPVPSSRTKPEPPPPTTKKVAPKPESEPPPSSEQHEPVAMVSAQPLAYLRVPTRPPPADEEAAAPEAIPISPPTPATPVSVPPSTVRVQDAAEAPPPTAPAPATAAPAPAVAAPAPAVAAPPAPATDAIPTDQELASYGVPAKRNLVVPLGIAGGVVALGAIVLLVVHLSGSSKPTPAASAAGPLARSAAAASPEPSSSAASVQSAAPAAASASAAPELPAQAVVRFECEPGCERIDCDGRQLAVDAGSATLDPGPHRCTATHRGYLPASDRFDVVAGQDITRHLELTKLQPVHHAAPHRAAPVHKKKKKACGTFLNPCK